MSINVCTLNLLFLCQHDSGHDDRMPRGQSNPGASIEPPPVDHKRVAAIQKAIKAGTYEIHADRIAQAILDQQI